MKRRLPPRDRRGRFRRRYCDSPYNVIHLRRIGSRWHARVTIGIGVTERTERVTARSRDAALHAVTRALDRMAPRHDVSAIMQEWRGLH